MRIGMPELIVVLVIAILIFGPKKLPELGSSIGKAIRSFKKSMDEGAVDSPMNSACSRCGVAVVPDARFCPSCGAEISRKVGDRNS